MEYEKFVVGNFIKIIIASTGKKLLKFIKVVYFIKAALYTILLGL